MKQLVRLISPAKINIVLAVGSVRDDGFHVVHTIMHTLALHDTLIMRRFEEEESGKGLEIRLKCTTSGDIDELNVAPENNIAYHAVEELARELDRHVDETIDMSLSKVIPAEAGLGGGSSNAAAALLGAAALWGLSSDDPRLYAVATRLGADVAFFLNGGCVYLSGKGDVFERSLAPRKGFVLLIRPDAGVSTAKAYAAFDKDPQLPQSCFIDALAAYSDAADIPFWNNLTDAACSVASQLAEVLEWARSTTCPEQVQVCGSGSAVAILCESYTQAQQYSLEVFKRGWWSRITSFSPVGVSVVESY